MKWWRSTYRFLGSVRFTIPLLALILLFVAAGTWVEGLTSSHAQASRLAYHHPLFSLLLCGLFVNILIAALQRWPWQRRHTPFLLAHLGLLMVISGVMTKWIFGTQGTITLVEGTSSADLLIPQSQALLVESGNERSLLSVKSQQLPSGPQIEILGIYPHSNRELAFDAEIEGLPTLTWNGPPLLVELAPLQQVFIAALQGNQLEELVRELYIHGTYISVAGSDRRPLWGLLKKEEANLKIDDREAVLQFGDLLMPLEGQEALLAYNPSAPFRCGSSIQIDLHRPSELYLLEDGQGRQLVVAFGPHGQIHRYSPITMDSVVSLDGGYAGYAAAVNLPFAALHTCRLDKEDEVIGQLGLPGLNSWLLAWYRQGTWLANTDEGLTEEAIASVWDSLTVQRQQGAYWVCHLFDQRLPKSDDLLATLHAQGWPLIEELQYLNADALYTTLTQQVFEAAERLGPSVPNSMSLSERAHQLSALLRASGIPLLLPQHPLRGNKALPENVRLLLPLNQRIKSLKPLAKLEDCCPCLEVRVTSGRHSEIILLPYDATATGLKWPALNGQLLLRFQPMIKQLPHRLRLREGRQLCYPGSSQPYSYESDLTITDNQGRERQISLSMNHVFQTSDGYRFYMSNISTPDKLEAKQVQITVNRDIAKYWLTYPGGVLVSLGIILLYARKMSKR